MGNCQQFNPQDQVKGVHKLQPLSLMIKFYTWNRDSHGLFDYESKNIIKGQVRSTSQIVALIRQKEEIKVFQSLDEQKIWKDSPDISELLQLHNKLSKYIVDSQSFLTDQKTVEESEGLQESCIWMVVKSIPNKNGVNGYHMKEGDYIKLGRVRFRIREIQCQVYETKLESQLGKMVSVNNLQILHNDKAKNITEEDNDDDCKSKASNSEVICRICLGGIEPNNPLVDVCKCQGSVKFIHIQCLQKWLGNKLAPKITKFSVSFLWKKFECELCKSPFPNIIDQNGISYDTVEIPKPQVPFITLEILSREKNQSKGTHIISLANKPHIKLGRGHDSDVRITDISVSRFHAVIKFSSGGFYLEDNRSKFGTLALMRGLTNIGVEENNNLAVQIGRSVISFQVKREWKVGNCCFSGPLTQENPDADEVQQIKQGDRDSIMMNRPRQSRIIGENEVEDVQRQMDQEDFNDNDQDQDQDHDQEQDEEFSPAMRQTQHQAQTLIQGQQGEQSPFALQQEQTPVHYGNQESEEYSPINIQRHGFQQPLQGNQQVQQVHQEDQ